MLTHKIALVLGLVGSAHLASARSGPSSPSAGLHGGRRSLNFGPAPAASHRYLSTAATELTSIPAPDGLVSSSQADRAPALQPLIESLFGPGAPSASIAAVGHIPAKGWYVRPDSYTDPVSGIQYVYLRQTIHGLDVDDGKAMIVRGANGELLAVSDSFYHGAAPTSPLELNSLHSSAFGGEEALDAHCAGLRETLSVLLESAGAASQGEASEYAPKREAAGQLVFGAASGSASPSNEEIAQLRAQLYKTCSEPSDSPLLMGAELPDEEASVATASDPRFAVLDFIEAATVDSNLVSALQDPQGRAALAEQISSTFEVDGAEQTLVGHKPARQIRLLHDVPGTSGPVKAKLGYSQRTNADGTAAELVLGWKLEVPMDHSANSNLYEAFVGAEPSGASTIVSAVDWVKSLAIPREEEHVAEAFETHDVSEPELVAQDETATDAPLYKVFQFGVNDPTEAKRSLLRGANDSTASPFGWHTIPASSKNARSDSPFKSGKTFKDLRGNRVLASVGGINMEDWEIAKYQEPSSTTKEGAPVWDFPFPWRSHDKNHTALEPKTYSKASVTNLFYTLNEYLDLLQRYGFDARSGNFEEAEILDKTEGYQGRGGDAFAAYAQSAAGTNNADCTTPPDGQRPRIRMYNWHNPPMVTDRDGDFEAGVIYHEATHGVSTRLTGGPSDSGCLGWGEAGGMGEGWGDFLATIIRRKTPTRDIYTMGSWVSHNKGGIRKYPYSTNLTLSPETYETLNGPGYWGVHAIGEVWSAMLYQVEEGLRAKLGWHHSLFPPLAGASQKELDEFYLTEDEIAKRLPASARGKRASKRPVPRHGNTLAFQLVIDGMKLQPCRPNFLSARDAIIAADKQLTGGANTCLIWERFAQRGLGTDAKVVGQTPWGGGVRTNGHAVPSFCKSKSG